MSKNSRCFFSDKACLAEIEMVCLEGKFSYKVQRKAERTNKWKSPIPAAGRGATLREPSGTVPAVSTSATGQELITHESVWEGGEWK